MQREITPTKQPSYALLAKAQVRHGLKWKIQLNPLFGVSQARAHSAPELWPT